MKTYTPKTQTSGCLGKSDPETHNLADVTVLASSRVISQGQEANYPYLRLHVQGIYPHPYTKTVYPKVSSGQENTILVRSSLVEPFEKLHSKLRLPGIQTTLSRLKKLEWVSPNFLRLDIDFNTRSYAVFT